MSTTATLRTAAIQHAATLAPEGVAPSALVDFASLVAAFIGPHLRAGLDMDEAIKAAVADVQGYLVSLRADRARLDALVSDVSKAVHTELTGRAPAPDC